MQEPTEDCGSVCGGYCGLRGDTAQRENAEERKYEDEIKKDLSGPAVGVHGDDHDAVRCLCGGGRCSPDR